MRFPDSALAHQYLDGLLGVEIGGAAHNPFGLATGNVDQLSHLDPRAEIYATEQLRQCGEVMPVASSRPATDSPSATRASTSSSART